MSFRLLIGASCKWFETGFLLFAILASSNSSAQQIRVESRNKVSPRDGAWYPWYEIAADPTNPNRLIVCGHRWVARDNAMYGFLYSTSDGGKTWGTAVEDKNSAWVSEQSCAFGVNGQAYFVSAASKVIDGMPHHDMGTTRILVSSDAGDTWAEATKTGWADYSISVVETLSGPDQNRLYTFYNGTHEAGGEAKRAGARVSDLSLITFKYGEKQVKGPIVNHNMDNHVYFPKKVFLLKDGSLLALYLSGVRADKNLDGIIGAARVNTKSLTLSDPVLVIRAPMQSGNIPGCGAPNFAAAYDSSDDRVYVAYHTFENQQCRFMLTASTDGGTTWSKGEEIPEPLTMGHRYYSPAMAVNANGTLGLLWRDGLTSDCWYFSASSDRGTSFLPAQSLSRCSSNQILPVTESNAFLSMLGVVPSDHLDLGLQIVDKRNYIIRNIGSLAATSDGVFHPVWIEFGNGEGQLRTATVTVGAPGQQQFPHLFLQEKDASDISEEVALLYGGDQHYDVSSGTLAETIVLKNKSKQPIKGPLLLKAITLNSTLGKLEIANASNGGSGPGAIWDLSKTLPNGVLEPGATTEPYSLVFRIPSDAAPLWETEVVSMRLTVLAAAAPPPSPR